MLNKVQKTTIWAHCRVSKPSGTRSLERSPGSKLHIHPSFSLTALHTHGPSGQKMCYWAEEMEITVWSCQSGWNLRGSFRETLSPKLCAKFPLKWLTATVAVYAQDETLGNPSENSNWQVNEPGRGGSSHTVLERQKWRLQLYQGRGALINTLGLVNTPRSWASTWKYALGLRGKLKETIPHKT